MYPGPLGGANWGGVSIDPTNAILYVNMSRVAMVDQLIPRDKYDKIDKIRGMEITVVTSARTDEQGRRLLQLLGMPFVKKGA